jgi:hypothetical protein
LAIGSAWALEVGGSHDRNDGDEDKVEDVPPEHAITSSNKNNKKNGVMALFFIILPHFEAGLWYSHREKVLMHKYTLHNTAS